MKMRRLLVHMKTGADNIPLTDPAIAILKSDLAAYLPGKI